MLYFSRTQAWPHYTYLTQYMERWVMSVLLLYLSPYFSHSCCHSWTRIMPKSCFSLMISTRSVTTVFQIFVKILHFYTLKSTILILWPSFKLFFCCTSGVCLPFHQVCAAAAPGNGLFHILLSCGLKSRKTFRIQTKNGECNFYCFNESQENNTQ